MDVTIRFLLTVGCLLLAGLAADTLGHRTKLPRVTIMLIFGFIVGPSVLDFVPQMVLSWFPMLTTIALGMVGFLLGGQITLESIKNQSKLVLSISIAAVVITAIFVGAGQLAIGSSLAVVLLLAGLSAATAPAATTDVIFELKAKGPFTQVLLGIVAIDDAWTLILFSLSLVFVHYLLGHAETTTVLIGEMIWEIVGAVILGLVLGLPMAYLSGRIKPGNPTTLEAVGIVFVGCGIAFLIHASFILAMMVLGCTVTNLAKHHKYAFHAIENIEWPFMVLFFILAGASFHINMLYIAGIPGVLYIVMRILGRVIGGWLGSVLVSADKRFRHWMGLSLMPQAGLAIGMGLIAAQTFPEYKDIILPIVLGSAVVFELIGPILTRKALSKVGEIPHQPQSR